MSLPAPTADQAFCNVSALEGGIFEAFDDLFIADGIPGKRTSMPSLCFLIQHSEKKHKFLFDLGVNSDITQYPTVVQEMVSKPDAPLILSVSEDCIQALAKGNTTPDDIDTVCISHCHWDHTGDTHAFKKSTFVVGSECRSLFEKAFPEDPTSWYASDLLPADRTQYISEWKGPIGPFPRVHDFFGDGSLYIIDSPGHLVGHVNILARTSSDGGWIYLAGDSAHHWRLLTGESEIKVGMPYGPTFCMHGNKAVAEEHIGHIKELRKLSRVRILLAHDTPWYNENKGNSSFWPGKIDTL